MPADLERLTSTIPQLDGPIPYDEDVLSPPNVSSVICPVSFCPLYFWEKHIWQPAFGSW